MRHILALIEPLRTNGLRAPVRATSADLPDLTGIGGEQWEPAITGSVRVALRAFGGDFSALGSSSSSISLQLEMQVIKETYSDADQLDWSDAPVTLYHAAEGDTWPIPAFVMARVRSYRREKNTLTLTCTVDTEPFEVDVPTGSYAGTTGTEGGADLKDTVKPLVLGHARNVEPVAIDLIDNVYQFSAYGPIEAVTTLYERGADFGVSVGDFASYAALVAADIEEGRWGTCLAEGLIRLGAPAFGVITGDVRGHEVSGAAPRLPGSLISVLMDLAGVSSALAESGTLTALDADKPYPMSLVLRETRSLLDIAREIGAACNHIVGVNLLGQLFVQKIRIGATPDIELDAQGKSWPQVISAREESTSAPYSRIMLGAEPCWRVHTTDEIAFQAELVERGAYDNATWYREGNIVSSSDGSRWLYTATVPGSGNAPPTWPIPSNAQWTLLTDPSSADWNSILNRPGDAAFARALATGTMSQGGFGDLVLTKDQDTAGNPSEGEIRVQGTRFYHPDGTIRTITNNILLPTPFEGSFQQNPFFVVFTDEPPLLRFGGGDPAVWPTFPGWSEDFFPAAYDPVSGQWRAYNNDQSSIVFTPVPSDCIVAIGRKASVSGGIDELYSLVASNPLLPEDGATVGGNLVRSPFGLDQGASWVVFNSLSSDLPPGNWPATARSIVFEDGHRQVPRIVGSPVGKLFRIRGWISTLGHTGGIVGARLRNELGSLWDFTMIRGSVSLPANTDWTYVDGVMRIDATSGLSESYSPAFDLSANGGSFPKHFGFSFDEITVSELGDISPTEAAKLAGIESNADVTANAQISIPQPAAFDIQADSAGVTTSNLATITRSIEVFRGGDKQTTGVTVGTITRLPSGSITVAAPTISSGTVTVRLTKADASGSITVPIIFGGKTYNVTIEVRRTLAAPTTPAANDNDSYVDQTWANVSGTVFAQVAGDGNCESNASGQVRVRYAASYTGGQARCKAQYRLESGGSWIDVPGSDVTGSTPISIPGEQQAGEIAYGFTNLTGLSANTMYRFRLLALSVSGSLVSWNAPVFTVVEP